MRLPLACCCLILGAGAAFVVITAAETERLRQAAVVMTSVGTNPDTAIPTDAARQAACVAVIPSVKKAAFLIGGEYGKGVMTCRTEHGWSAPVFLQLEKGSWGFQAGAEEIDLVLLMMDRRGADKLLQDKVSLGAGVSVAAGPVGRTARAGTDAHFEAEILSYSQSRGLFAGANIAGGVLGPDADANRNVYGPSATARQIASGTIAAPGEAKPFMAAIRQEFAAVSSSARR